MTDNVVVFPKAKRETPPQSIEDIMDSVQKMREMRTEEILYTITPMIISQLLDNGVNIEDEDCSKSIALLFESIKALIYKSFKMNHPLHEFSSSVFSIREWDEDGLQYVYDLTKTEEETNS